MKGKRKKHSASSQQGTPPDTLLYKGNQFVLIPTSKDKLSYAIKSILILEGPILEIPSTYKGIPIRCLHLPNMSYSWSMEEIYEILLPKEIKTIVTTLPRSDYYHLVHPPNGLSLTSSLMHLKDPFRVLKAITPCEDHPFFESVDGILYSKDRKKLIMCPAGNGLEEFQVPEGTEQIGKYAFLLHQKLREIHFPSTLTTVEKGAFSFCLSLEKVYFKNPSRLSLIQKCAFQHCYIGDISFPEAPFSLEKEAFLDGLHGHVVLPSTIQKIGALALSWVDELTIVEGSAKGIFKAFEVATIHVLPEGNKEEGFTFRLPGQCPSWMLKELSAAWDKGNPLLPLLDSFVDYIEKADMDLFTVPLFMRFPDKGILPKVWEQVRTNAFYVASTFLQQKDTGGFQAFLNTGILPPQEAALLLPDVNNLGLTDCAAYLLEYCKGTDTKSEFAL